MPCPGPGLCSKKAFGEQKKQNLRKVRGLGCRQKGHLGNSGSGSREAAEQLRDLSY